MLGGMKAAVHARKSIIQLLIQYAPENYLSGSYILGSTGFGSRVSFKDNMQKVETQELSDILSPLDYCTVRFVTIINPIKILCKIE